MILLPSPVVYVGPTLSREEVSDALPGSIIRPPICRGDLYRDRLLRGSVFLILDGVFFQQQAISPREILDVIEDGALVVGASSMGALRAAECWPAGMLGVGSIYRLFRRGALGSDDEVAVTFDAEEPLRRSSVALVNVRYAVWRMLQTGEVDCDLAKRVVASAQALFYADRRWPAILGGAGALELLGPVARSLGGFDLKRLDALRALRRVARLRALDPALCVRPRRSLSPFILSEDVRERAHDALEGHSAAESLRELTLWLLASGRYTRYPSALGGNEAGPVGKRASAQSAEQELRRWFEKKGLFEPEETAAFLERWSLRRRDMLRAAGARAKIRGLIEDFFRNEEQAVAELAAAVALSGELDAELFRCRAVQRLAACAAELGLEPTELDCHEAEQQIVFEHDCESWHELSDVLLGSESARELVTSYRQLLARAGAMRRRWLERPATD